MLASSSNRARSSTSTATSFPAWAALVSAFAIGDVGLTRYSVMLMARTRGSAAASCTKRVTTSKGW
jgi:hypothetical protein